MNQTVTVSSKFQVIIPRKVREALGIRAGHKIQVVPYGDRIELIPVKPIQEMPRLPEGDRYHCGT